MTGIHAEKSMQLFRKDIRKSHEKKNTIYSSLKKERIPVKKNSYLFSSDDLQISSYVIETTLLLKERVN